MSTATELSGVVSIDADRSLEVRDISADLGDIISRTLAVAILQPLDNTGKPRPPADLRKQIKTKEPAALTKLTAHLAVTDEESYLRVGNLVAEATRAMKEIGSEVEDDKRMASELHQRICDREFVAQFPYRLVKAAGDTNINAFVLKNKQEAEAEQRKQMEAAQAEQRRLQAEADNKLREQQALENAAREAKRSGDMAAAREAQQQAAAVVQQAEVLQEKAAAVVDQVVHTPALPKLAGRTEKWPWVGKGEDLMVTLKAIVAGELQLYHDIPVKGGGTERRSIVNWDDPTIQYYAKRLEANARIPGVKFEETLQSAQRSK